LSADNPTVAQASAPVEYDFGDFSSETLATKAWKALEALDYAAVEAYTTKCIALYEAKALEQQASLTAFAPKDAAFTYWALNDVATCYFILGKARAAQGKVQDAQDALNTIIQRLGFAQCWDPKGWFWKVAEGAKDQLNTLGTAYDFGDYTSQTLTVKAWEALGKDDHKGVELYAKKCIALYEAKALEQQASLTDFAPKERAFDYWALNDVATSYFILGRSYQTRGDVKEAETAFKAIVEKFSYAQCWDPKGWFWKVAQGAQDRLNTLGTAYDFGDYTSETLTVKAWGALDKSDHKGVELYTKKCIELYEEEAKKQQASLTEFAPKDKAFNYWALNDVATCYFILGESLMAQGRYQDAKAAFERIVNDLSFAQCWDPKGWFWKVAVGARGRLNKILAESGN
jgi:tetratricopeptide (TPR) repeat protein